MQHDTLDAKAHGQRAGVVSEGSSALLVLADVLNGRGYQCVRYLGLVARDAPLRVANPIYALPCELAWVAQETLDVSPPRYVRSGAQVPQVHKCLHACTHVGDRLHSSAYGD